ncbi:hypothetical protein ACOI1H_13360 [Loktanella sp. DJP18]|uniref:hypothetical protein n=1 Tax=Loktanella sp. DJP18 TaxID=3409788 RepID=UPI003BB4FD26
MKVIYKILLLILMANTSHASSQLECQIYAPLYRLYNTQIHAIKHGSSDILTLSRMQSALAAATSTSTQALIPKVSSGSDQLAYAALIDLAVDVL